VAVPPLAARAGAAAGASPDAGQREVSSVLRAACTAGAHPCRGMLGASSCCRLQGVQKGRQEQGVYTAQELVQGLQSSWNAAECCRLCVRGQE
jgi:hypothetical protein